MNELKSLKNIGLLFDATTLHKQVIAEDSEGNCYGFDSSEEIYIKSEADKVIAEKDEKIVLYKIGWEESDRINSFLYRRERHHKYKRCLAMAKLCKRKSFDAADYRIPRKKWEFYDKWHKRWLELAEKFKERK